MDLKPGQIVISKAGRDKGYIFVVFSIISDGDGDFVYLIDGKERSVTKPKKKKRKHIQPTLAIDENIAQLISQNANLKDADFKAAIKNFKARQI